MGGLTTFDRSVHIAHLKSKTGDYAWALLCKGWSPAHVKLVLNKYVDELEEIRRAT